MSLSGGGPDVEFVLACADGCSNTEVAQRLRVAPGTVTRWRARGA